MIDLKKRSSKQHPAPISLHVPTRTVIRVLLLVVLFMVGLAAIREASHALLLIFAAFFLALSLNAPVHWLAQRLPGKRKGNRTLATSLSFFTIIILLAAFLASIVPPLVRQTSNFISAAPRLVEQARDENNEVGEFIRRYNLQEQVNDLSGQLGDRLKNATGTAWSAVGKVSSSIFTILTILVLTFMMLIEGPRWRQRFRDIIPNEHQGHADELAKGMYKVIKGYVNGQVTLAAIAAVLLLPAMLILGIDYPIALMVIVFVCGLIPMVGHTIGAVIVSIVALFHSLPAALIILGYYILYQQIENYVIQPKVQSNSTNMSPLLVFMSVVIGVSFGGLFGGLVAIPVAGCIRIAVLDYLHRKKIIDSNPAEPTPKPKPAN